MARTASHSSRPQPDQPAADAPSFEAALSELEAIVQAMESGRSSQGEALTLEASLSAYRRGSELLKHCQDTLAHAEQQIAVLENGELRNDAERTLARPGS